MGMGGIGKGGIPARMELEMVMALSKSLVKTEAARP